MKSRSQNDLILMKRRSCALHKLNMKEASVYLSRQNKTIIAPKKDHYVTVGELLDEYVQLYGLKHWEIPTYPAVSILSRIILSRRLETFWSKT